jgi:hypothetical protein
LIRSKSLLCLQLPPDGRRDARQGVRVRSVPVHERVGVPHAAEPAGRHLRPKSSKQHRRSAPARPARDRPRRAHRSRAHAAVQPAAWRRLRAEQPHRTRHIRRPLLLGSARVDLQLHHRLPGASAPLHLYLCAPLCICDSVTLHLCAYAPPVHAMQLTCAPCAAVRPPTTHPAQLLLFIVPVVGVPLFQWYIKNNLLEGTCPTCSQASPACHGPATGLQGAIVVAAAVAVTRWR